MTTTTELTTLPLAHARGVPNLKKWHLTECSMPSNSQSHENYIVFAYNMMINIYTTGTGTGKFVLKYCHVQYH